LAEHHDDTVESLGTDQVIPPTFCGSTPVSLLASACFGPRLGGQRLITVPSISVTGPWVCLDPGVPREGRLQRN